MKAKILNRVDPDQVMRAENLHIPIPVREPIGEVSFRLEEITAVIREGNVLSIVLKSGFSFDVLHEDRLWIEIQKHLNEPIRE